MDPKLGTTALNITIYWYFSLGKDQKRKHGVNTLYGVKWCTYLYLVTYELHSFLPLDYPILQNIELFNYCFFNFCSRAVTAV